MFDGAAPVVVETSISDADAGDATAQETTDAAQQAETAFAREQENLATVDSSDTAAPPVQVVVYDAGIQDIDSLIANLSGDIKAYALPAGQDPFEAIAAILKEAGTVETLYVLSHGSEGKMYLGDEVVDQATLESRAFRSIYSARQLAELEERNHCPENDKLCQEALSFSQTTLLGTRSDLDQIVEAIRKIHGQAAELARAPLSHGNPLA